VGYEELNRISSGVFKWGKQAMIDLWDVFQQAQIHSAANQADSAKQDSARTDRQLQTETQRLESKIDGLALICQALYEVLRERTAISEQEIEAKIKEIDLRDGRSDGRITGHPTQCPNCNRTAHTRQNVCMYCSTPIPGGHLFEKAR
jgi:hypothetical protein